MEIKLDSSKIDFKIDPKKVIQNLFDFNIGSAITEIVNVSSSIESSAFALLYNTAWKTNVQLCKKINQKALNEFDNLSVVHSQIKSEWSAFLNDEIVIKSEFFNNILQHDNLFLVKAYLLFKKYVEIIGIEIPENFYLDYYISFRENLSLEFQLIPTKYNLLIHFFQNPIEEQNEDFNRQIEHYREIGSNFTAKLQSGVEESFETLKDLYIPPYFHIFHRNTKVSTRQEFISPTKKIDLNNMLLEFYYKGILPDNLRSDYNMIFILGQPGQGKTSLCYKFIHDILIKSQGIPTIPFYFIKIRDLHTKDFVNDTFSTIQKFIQQNIDFESEKCMLILDGLDEAYMSGGINDSDLKNLYERLKKTSKTNRELKIVLTSRLNYLKLDDPSVEGSLVLKIDTFDNIQIKEYLEKFKYFYPENKLANSIEEIIGDERFEHIIELLEQPVLMYFIALTNIDIESDDSKGIIYNKIFDSLALRSWDKNGQLDHIKNNLKSDPKKFSKHLRQYIRNIAFEIYQSPNLHLSINKLINLDATKDFAKKCFNETIFDDKNALKNIGKYLLISFYFQSSTKTDEEGDSAIEFFHNSLWEYLTAEHMWEEYKLSILKVDEDGDLQPISLEEYFNQIKHLVGNKYFKIEVRKNLENIIQVEKFEIKKNVFNQSKDLFFKLLNRDMIMTYDWKNEQLSVRDKMNCIFELSWTLYYYANAENNIIQTNDNFNEFFFDLRSNLSYKYVLTNLKFVGDFFQNAYISDCDIDNVSFEYNGIMQNFNIENNHISNSTFALLYGIDRVNNNTFENVTFNQIAFTKASEISDNTFINCKFFEVIVPHKNSLNDLIKVNEFDSEFISRHDIEEDDNGNFTINYKE